MTVPKPANLTPLNALGLHSDAEFFLEAATVTACQEGLQWANARQLPIHVIGGGTNVLLAPRVNGLVLYMATRGVQVIDDDGRYVTLRVAAGENWHAFVAWCTRLGYHGLANLAWIPGTVGAAPVQNVGAYGVEVERYIDAVHALEISSGQPRMLSHSECGFSYRESVFKRAAGEDFLITAIDFRLDRLAEPVAEYPSLREELGSGAVTHQRVFDAVIAVRKRRLPDHLTQPNVGSFFKNPAVSWNVAEVYSMRWPDMPQYASDDGKIKLSAAWMIDRLGFRGVERNDVAVDPGHALILVNRGATDVSAFLGFADEIVTAVENEYELTLEREPRLLGVPELA